MICVFLTLGSFAPLAAPACGPVKAESELARAAEDAFAATVEQYTAAVKKWRDERRAAAKEGKEAEAAVEARHPVKEFWPGMQTLADGGEGRALVWMIEQADDYLSKSAEIAAKKAELVARLFEKHADADWAAEDLVGVLRRQRSWFDEAWVRAKLEELARVTKNKSVAAAATYELAQRLSAPKTTEAERKRAAELLARIEQEYPDSPAARALRMKKDATAYEVGGVPEFDAVDPDGVKFKLSDYRGKVVLLDFWGFW